MTRNPTRSILGSLKGRIWFAVSGLAVVNCVIGVTVFFLSSYVIADRNLSAFLAFLVAGFVTVVFGGWLSNDVLDPLNKVNLAAKSLERSPTASLPRTTGALETDEILDGIQRSAVQIQEVIGAMDEIAAGRVQAVQNTPKSYDRLGVSFQNLVNKVADSVNAANTLAETEREIATLADRLVRLRNGELDIEVVAGNGSSVRGIAETINFIAGNLRQLTARVQETSQFTNHSAQAVRDLLRQAITEDDARAARARVALGGIGELPQRVNAQLASLAAAFDSVSELPALLESQRASAASLKTEIETLRDRLESVHRPASGLREKAAVVPMSARLANEISKRVGLLAVNLSVVKGKNSSSESEAVIAREAETIASRSAELAKEAGAAEQGIVRDLSSLDNAVSEIRAEVNALGSKAAEMTAAFDEIDRGLRFLFEFKHKLPETSENSLDAQIQALESDLGSVSIALTPAEQETAKIATLASELLDAVSMLHSSGTQPASAAAAAAGHETFSPLLNMPDQQAADRSIEN